MPEAIQLPADIVLAAESQEANSQLAVPPLHPEKPDAPKFTMDDLTSLPETKTPVVTKAQKVDLAAKDTKAKEAEAPAEEAEIEAKDLPDIDEPEEVEETKEPEEPIAEEVKIHGNNKRDFTGFAKEEIKLLKGLDNKRFNNIAPIWKALKADASKVPELATKVDLLSKQLREGGVPDSWAEHPEAYVLSPEFKAINQQYSRVDFEDNFYQQQLASVKSGGDWQYIKAYDKATGQPVLSEARKASNQDDIWLTRTLANCAQAKGNLEGRLQGIQQTFQGQHQQFLQAVKSTTDSFISKLVDKVKPLEADEKLFEDMLPNSLRANPLAYAAKRQHGIIMQQARYIEELLKEKTTANKLANDRKLAGATPTKVPRGDSKPAAKNSSGVFSMDEIVPSY